MKLLNVLLCIVCLGFVAVIVVFNVGGETIRVQTDDVVAYVGDAGAQTDEAITTTAELFTVPESGLRRGLTASGTAGLAAQRWHQKLADARTANVAEGAAPALSKRDRELRKRWSARTNQDHIRQLKQQRRYRTVFERTRHYTKNRLSYERGFRATNPRVTSNGRFRVPRPTAGGRR